MGSLGNGIACYNFFMSDDESRLLFIKKYISWITATGYQQREITWVEYCTARDAYLGLKWTPVFDQVGSRF